MIRINNLTKRYEKLTAVDNLSLDIEQGEVFGLLGQNGAGKTTVIHMLATLLKPTSGSATVNNFDIQKEPEKVRTSIGIVFQVPSSDDLLTGYENLQIHAMLYGVDPSIREKRIQDALELVGLTERKDDQVKKYSGGMRRRLEIARGLIHSPKVLFLDEPTLGLDPSSRETMWKYIQQLVKQEKLTIILTTHYMEEADMLCNRIGIMDKGKIIALDTPTNLKLMLGGDIVKLKLKKHDSDITVLKNLACVKKIESFDGYVILGVDDAKKNIPEILKHVDVESVESSSPTLSDVFLKLTGKNIKEQAEGGFLERYVQYDKH
ncbi:Efflux ABC transporter, ATP-binding protein [Candidatus Nitrosotalea sp. FS]|uniref:ATP-binding cassette domain-containing protein n=1 Tax=Candidatus Nitrosotalea sp. FS TaxID=2341021 RepID=UPI00140A0F69|nr:ATP-binding cassette domain-containing protein [Candidatus Nitrosotalea sp. FS]NHH97557.1 Efflux ABC transporter, ATP-binding protein [Candidatus Nitrosotalea sp. FS]